MAIARSRRKAPTMRGSAPDGLQGDRSPLPCDGDLPPWGTTGSTSHSSGCPARTAQYWWRSRRRGVALAFLPYTTHIGQKFYALMSDINIDFIPKCAIIDDRTARSYKLSKKWDTKGKESKIGEFNRF